DDDGPPDGGGCRSGEGCDSDGDGIPDDSDDYPDDPCNGPCGCGGDPCCGSSDPCCGNPDPCCGNTDPCDPECGDPCDPACIDCDDGDPCTCDECEGGSCSNPDIAQPCLVKQFEGSAGCAGGSASLSAVVCNSGDCYGAYEWTATVGGDPVGLGGFGLSAQSCNDVIISVQVDAESAEGTVVVDLAITPLGCDAMERSAGCSTSATLEIRKLDLRFLNLPEEEENDPGAWVPRNDDDDNDNGQKDYLENSVVNGEDDLAPLFLKAPANPSGTVTLDFIRGAGRIKLYKNSDKSNPVSLPKTWTANEVPTGLFVEGATVSTSLRDIGLELSYAGPGGPCEPATMDFTVARVGIVTLQFNSDHNLMFDNDVDYEQSFTSLVQPEWFPSFSRNHPISHTMDIPSTVQLSIWVQPNALPVSLFLKLTDFMPRGVSPGGEGR
ncbi:MAG: hypothetical protein AABZ47_02660, partial [Planctomycetota bacterium]